MRAVGLSLLLAAVGSAATAADRPNLVLIIADDMAWNDCGAYGHPHIRTPNIDRLAKDGLRFDRAYLTTSSCSPSRSSMITGRYPHNTDAGQLHLPLPGNQVTFVELLKKSGYYTAAAGKWHLGPATKPKFDTVKEGGGPSGCENWVPVLRDRPKDQPFFLWLAAIDPHRGYQPNSIPKPHTADDVIIPPFIPDTSEVRKDFGLYYDEISRMDGFIGQVVAELDRQKVADDTLILFITDNGRPFPRCKTTLYDSGIRTPFIVRWPSRVKAGGITGSLVSSLDIAPTFLELAGVEAGPTFQGESFAKTLTDPAAPVRRYAIAEHNWHDFDDHQRGVRGSRFLYIRNHYTDIPLTPPADAVGGPTYQEMRRLNKASELTPVQAMPFRQPRPTEELYDSTTDPFQMRNLAGDPAHAAVLSEMRAELLKWEKATEDIVPGERRPDEFDRDTGRRLKAKKAK